MQKLRVLIVTSEWPTQADPGRVPFLVQHVEQMRAAGLEVEVFGFRGSKSPLNYFKAWRGLRRTHDLRRFDIVHGHFGQSGAVAWPCPPPLIMTFHGSDLQGVVGADGRYSRSSGLLRKISRYAARRAAENIVVSRRLAPFLPATARPAHVIPLGVDFERFAIVPRDEARRRLQLDIHKRLVLFAASPTNAVKRFELARQAVGQTDLPDVELVTLTGQSHDRVALYMCACDALVLTSVHEGSPTVVKEALACNLPIVSVDVGDVRERLEAVAGCFICDPTPETLAAGLAMVLETPQRLETRGQMEELDERRVVQRIEQVYRAAIERRRAG